LGTPVEITTRLRARTGVLPELTGAGADIAIDMGDRCSGADE
jgi:hypothetical protein